MVLEIPGGNKPTRFDPEFAMQPAVAERTTREDRELLRKPAQ